jgi:drug/metabolite transporter (DMT)-like permease
MSYIFFAWITTIFYTASGLVGKFAAKHKIENPWLYNFVWSLVVVIFSCVVAICFGVGWPSDWRSLIVAGFMSAVTAVAYTFSLYILDVSVLSSLYTFRAPMSVLLGVLWFKELLTPLQIGLIIAITIGGMFVSVDEHMSVRSFFRKPVLFGLFNVFLSTIYNANVKFAATQNSYWTTVFWYNLLTLLFLLGTIPFFRKEIPKFQLKNYSHVALSAILAGIGGITVIAAIVGNLGISTAILTLPLTLIAAMILSFVAPHLLEKHPPKVYAVRLVAALVMFAAALGLSR